MLQALALSSVCVPLGNLGRRMSHKVLERECWHALFLGTDTIRMPQEMRVQPCDSRTLARPHEDHLNGIGRQRVSVLSQEELIDCRGGSFDATSDILSKCTLTRESKGQNAFLAALPMTSKCPPSRLILKGDHLGTAQAGVEHD
jgi:hypothetical protein